MADFKQLIDQAVKKYGLPPEWRDIGQRQLMQESGGRLDAVSPVGARGPWQFMPATAKGYGLQNPNDPVASTDAWGRMMADMLKQTGGNPAHALAAYNWGIGNLNKHGLGKAPKETRDYLAKILGGANAGTKVAMPAHTPETPKVYTPAVNAVGAQDVRAAMAPDRQRPGAAVFAAAPMQAMPTEPYAPSYESPYAAQQVDYALPLDRVADDKFIERM